jgi:DNA-binding beta-propeller fold protein YncE
MRRAWLAVFGLAVASAIAFGAAGVINALKLGRQRDGGFIVSTGQRIAGGAIAFTGRPIDLARHPTRDLCAVLNKDAVFLINAAGVIDGSHAKLPEKATAGFRGLAWSPDGSRLIASTAKLTGLAVFKLEADTLVADGLIRLTGDGAKQSAVPGGMAITRDGRTLFVAAAGFNAVLEIDLAARKVVRRLDAQRIPFEVQLSPDERTLIVSNWGGRPPRPGEPTAKSDNTDIVVDAKGAPATGTVSLVDRATGAARHVDVGIHPTAIVARGNTAYVACAMSDRVDEIDLAAAKVTRSIPIRFGNQRLLGSMPNALALDGDTLYVADGGDNALAEVDLKDGAVRGFRPAGFYPVAVALDPGASRAYVLNTKGNGSVAKTILGRPGNAHDFQGSVSVIDLRADLAKATAEVAANNHWDRPLGKSNLKVYNGAIRHVIYIIKENRTYDEIFGDLPVGDGDPKLCSLGETVMPNHRKLAREFCLFDNAYVSGTNSADGHAWGTQCLANDYMEHFYTGYSRSYPDDGDDAMAYSNAGALWDAALAAGKRVRVYGEFCDEASAQIKPEPKDWFEVWEDRKAGGGKFEFTAVTLVASLKPHIHPNYLYWPLWQSDQHRADIFIGEYEQMARAGRLPELMILSLPCDHAEGTDPRYPTPRAMMADNDLALGRVVEAVSRSPQWKETCIFVIEDDAQSGPDHVDGHRTCYLAISPYTKRRHLDSTLYTQPNMFRSMELMLGLPPLNKFDACAEPMQDCFTDTPDYTPYRHVPNNVPLDERNPSRAAMSPADRFFMEKTLSLDWSKLDAADPYWLNRINWWSIFRHTRPYPGRPGERPEVGEPLERWPSAAESSPGGG